MPGLRAVSVSPNATHTARARQSDMTAAEEFIFCMVNLASGFVLLLFRGGRVIRGNKCSSVYMNTPLYSSLYCISTVDFSLSHFYSSLLICPLFSFFSYLSYFLPISVFLFLLRDAGSLGYWTKEHSFETS